MQGYDYTREQLADLVRVGFIPEVPKPEAAVIFDFLAAHADEYDRFSFSVRLGTPIAPDPTHLPAVQKSTVFSSMKRIDCIAWQGDYATIVEAKLRVNTDAIGKSLMYRQLFLEDQPHAPEPRMVVVGREVDDDVARVHSAQGIDIYLYEPGVDGGGASQRSV